MGNKSKCYLNGGAFIFSRGCAKPISRFIAFAKFNGLSDEQIKKFFKEVNQNKERK